MDLKRWLFWASVLVGYGKSELYYSVKEDNKTVIYNNDLQLDTTPDWLAQASYESSSNKTGWDVLEIRTNPDFPDEVQVFEAGFLEGYLTYREIYFHWQNTLNDTCKNNSSLCNKIKQFFNSTYNTSTNTNLDEPFWYHVHLYNLQLEGIFIGYNEAIKDYGGIKLSLDNIMWLNSFTKVKDLVKVFNMTNNSSGTQEAFKMQSTALIKIMPGFRDVFFGHSVSAEYSCMNRILKRYTFPIHTTKNSSDLVRGIQMSFSSYPATIGSLDDFYLISSGLVTMRTPNTVYNSLLYKNITSQNQVLEVMRSVVANRLAGSASVWKDYFFTGNCTTCNSQWMILDLKLFKPGFQLKKDFLWIVEEMPGLKLAADLTDHFVAHGHWMSYNIPYFKQIYAYSGTEQMFSKYGQLYSYNKNIRPLIFHREMSSVYDSKSMLELLRYNHYKSDPYSACHDCVPEQLPMYSISPRGDLYPLNASTKHIYKGYKLYGGIDVKVSSYSQFSKGALMLVVGGPTTSDGLPSFQWSKAQTQANHFGQPDLWDFKPFIVNWFLGIEESSNAALLSPFSILLYLQITITIAYMNL